MKKSAHLSGTAGQIRNPIEIVDTEEMFLSKRSIQTLGDYIKQVQASENPPKKLTFDEWWEKNKPEHGPVLNYMFWASSAWKAAQENNNV